MKGWGGGVMLVVEDKATRLCCAGSRFELGCTGAMSAEEVQAAKDLINRQHAE